MLAVAALCAAVFAAPPQTDVPPSGPPATQPATRPAALAFFTTDNGRTFFAADATLVPPFQHEGRSAYRCKIFRCPKGKPFVNHLEGYAPDVKKQMEQEIAAGRGNPMAVIIRYNAHVQVRRPDGDRWVAMTAANAQAYADIVVPRHPDCPGEPLETVRPE